MAEILGAVASSLQVAGLAFKFTTIGFKLHTLYREVKEAPAEIIARLIDTQVIAQMLDELNRSPMAAHAALRTARSHCERCLQELRATLHTLDVKIRSSGVISAKVKCLNFILRKNDIAKMGNRLETSLRLLFFAIQVAMLRSHERLGWVFCILPPCNMLIIHGLSTSLTIRIRQLIESQCYPSSTFYAASFATQSCITLGEPYPSTNGQMNRMCLLLPGVTDQGEAVTSLSSILLEENPRTGGGEVTHGLARQSVRSRHHLPVLRRTLQPQ
ncbi:hypothetical protein KVR01_004184 [Diaporthe batatas]|uniref:uncharacterized protein n=1 Tax=Diaporthe batatas TaxID=748121 RepID=UPI001D04D44D|nr:uncharacterized protein KVR01_004184 [Diaporthe batatas]KAG8165632.1 hypothetical protein KVR01_004184 [Diaporthe batatas]